MYTLERLEKDVVPFISFHARDKDEIELVVRDIGVGIPDDINFRNCDSLGLQLVRLLAEDQLDGRIVLKKVEELHFISHSGE